MVFIIQNFFLAAQTWRKSELTWYTSYPDPNSDECIIYNGCLWAGYFAYLVGKQPESWVRQLDSFCNFF